MDSATSICAPKTSPSNTPGRPADAPRRVGRRWRARCGLWRSACCSVGAEAAGGGIARGHRGTERRNARSFGQGRVSPVRSQDLSSQHEPLTEWVLLLYVHGHGRRCPLQASGSDCSWGGRGRGVEFAFATGWRQRHACCVPSGRDGARGSRFRCVVRRGLCAGGRYLGRSSMAKSRGRRASERGGTDRRYRGKLCFRGACRLWWALPGRDPGCLRHRDDDHCGLRRRRGRMRVQDRFWLAVFLGSDL